MRARRRPTLLVALVGLMIGCGPTEEPQDGSVLTVSAQRADRWERNFNPLAPGTTPCWPTRAGVHEPLMVFNSVQSEFVPWLALSSAWSDDARRLRVELRPGVRWSDGARFDADDVVFTFELLRDHPTADQYGVWRFLDGVRAVDATTVEFALQRAYVPGFADLVRQPIVPEHVWSAVDDPLTFANQHPVGTGPFTEVLVFEDHVYELGRNPHYWQPGAPGVDRLRLPAYADNDASNMGLLYDDVDWSGDFIPAIDRVFTEKDPQAHHYWFPLTGGCIFLYANTTRDPFDDVRVRKALGAAIDRDLLVDVAMFRYTRPADATGLTDAFASWRDSSAVRRGAWIDAGPDAADARFDAAGLRRGTDGVRQDAAGTPVQPELLCVRGWTDWERVADFVADDLAARGIDVRVSRLPFEEWNRRVSTGDFDLALGWSLEGTTPYDFYRGLMSSTSRKPVGEPASTNWHRYASARADSLFARFERTSSADEQRRIARRLQHVFVDEAPAVPLFPGPSWAAYETHRVTGFPSPDDPYANPSPHQIARGEILLVLTHVRPVTVGR